VYQDYELLIAGAWRQQGGGGNLDVLDPARGVADAEHKGARVEAGDKRPDHRKQGFFFEPTLPPAVPDHALALAEENFGPIAAIRPFGDAEEACTRDADMVGVNSFALAAAEAPFGGIKDSGRGREGGSEGILGDRHVKLVHVTV
jgi:succinate-semialdehyde dehydrogenase/glutarate-semialdehyde dehydrogenase